MDIDLLISRYLDADLTVEDDLGLRELLANDPLLKEQFNTAVSLHHSMEFDDSIETPRQLVEETEKILETIMMSSSPRDGRGLKPSQASKRKIQFGRQSVLPIVTIAVMLLIGVPIGDEFLGGGSGLASIGQPSDALKSSMQVPGNVSPTALSLSRSSVLELVQGKRLTQSHLETTDGIAQLEQPLHLVSPEAETPSQLSIGYLSSLGNIQPFTSSRELHNSDVQRNNDFQPSTSLESSIDVRSAVSALGIPVSNAFSSLNQDLMSGSVQNSATPAYQALVLSTTVSNSVTSSVHIRNVAQALSYSVTEEDNIGLELGYVSLADGSSQIQKNSSSALGSLFRDGYGSGINGPDDPESGSGKDMPGSPDGGDKLGRDNTAEGGKGSSNKGSTEFEVTNRMSNYYWGAAFYERSLFDFHGVTMKTRAGVGTSLSGIVSYGRAYLKYNVFSNVALSAGAEGSTLLSKSASTAQNPKSFLLLSYGIQINF